MPQVHDRKLSNGAELRQLHSELAAKAAATVLGHRLLVRTAVTAPACAAEAAMQVRFALRFNICPFAFDALIRGHGCFTHPPLHRTVQLP